MFLKISVPYFLPATRLFSVRVHQWQTRKHYISCWKNVSWSFSVRLSVCDCVFAVPRPSLGRRKSGIL